jgi:hypothetical protein
MIYVTGLPWALEVISSYMAFTYADSRASTLALDIINLFTVSREDESSVSSYVLDIIIFLQ